MHRRSTQGLTVLFALLTSMNAGAQDKALEGEMEFGPVKLVHEVAGKSVTTPAKIYLTLKEAGEGYHLRGRTLVDLSPLQGAAATVLSGVALPTDNCARYAPDNLVVSLRDPRISVTDGRLLLRVSGDVTVWQCIENIVPGFKIEMRPVGNGFARINVPTRVEFRQSSPIKNSLPTQSFVVTIPFEPYVSVGDRVALRRLSPSVELTGNNAQLVKTLLDALGVNLSEKAEGVLSKAIPPTELDVLLPEVARPLHPRIVKSQFIDEGKAKLEIDFEGTGTGEQVSESLKALFPSDSSTRHTSSEQESPPPSTPATNTAVANCKALKTPAEIPSGYHPERVVWRPESADGDLVCLSMTTGTSIRFVAWKGLTIPKGYAAVRQDASLDTQERGCQTPIESVPGKCSTSWTAYELAPVPTTPEKQETEVEKTQAAP